jgi:hypothetical protein
MAYQARSGSPRNSGRGRGIPRHEKAKAKEHRRRDAANHRSEEDHATTEEIVNRTLNALHNLGKQKFVLPPYSEHLDRWLTNLRQVLSDLETNPDIAVDEQFKNERSQIMSNIKLDPQKSRLKEASSIENVEKLRNKKNLLEEIEEDYSDEKQKIEERKKSAVEHLSKNIDDIKREQSRIAQIKTGFFRAISKKTRTQKEAEALVRLNVAQNELASVNKQFTVEQEKAREEYERKKKTVIDQIRDIEKEAQNQETDDSVEIRGIISEELIEAVNKFLQRKGLLHP